jgi:hypothetical protein
MIAALETLAVVGAGRLLGLAKTCSSRLAGSPAARLLGLLHVMSPRPTSDSVYSLRTSASGLDELVHEGLRHRGVVALVVAAAAVADHVDHDVLVELLAELEGQLGHPHARPRGRRR